MDSAFHAAGHLRDIQMAVQRLRRLEARFPEAGRLAHHLQRATHRQREKVTREVRALSYRCLRKEAEGWRPASSPTATRVAQARACRRLVRAEEALLKLERSNPTARQLHALRIQLKHVRYIMELCRTLRVGAHPRWPMPKIRRLQVALGNTNDIRVLQEIVGRYGSRHERWRRRAEGLSHYLDGQHRALRERAIRMTTLRLPCEGRAPARPRPAPRTGGSTG